MKNISLLLFFAFFSFQVIAQDKQSPTQTPSDPAEVFTIVEQMPAFPGGEQAMSKYMIDNLAYPEKAKKDKVTGTVFVSFIVNEKGGIQGAKVIRGVSPELDAEALRVVNAMPAWTPGKQNGKAVNVQFNLPVKFIL